MYWDPKIECMPKEELKKLQYRSMKQLVNNLYSFNKFYHDRMKEQNVHPDDIPTTGISGITKEKIEEYYRLEKKNMASMAPAAPSR